ncbi:MAG TPA: uracil-DNA glycosylase family protein [Pyrinomonadaceae bacterium]|nr:uracil-DNA glycosylase family protein [Pyrinomonadaceae bacterium]
MKSTLDKRSALLRLAKVRQSTRRPGYKCIGAYHGGVYECDFVSPYTITAGNVDAEIMVMLQDWASDDDLKHPLDESSATLGYDPCAPTNKKLIKLLHTTFGVALRDTYATNLFPFIKLGRRSKKIPPKDMLAAAQQFALPQIRMVDPKLVICLGKDTFNAVREACEFSPSQYLDSAIENPFCVGTTRVWCQTHTGRLSNRGPFERVLNDWRKMKEDVY